MQLHEIAVCGACVRTTTLLGKKIVTVEIISLNENVSK